MLLILMYHRVFGMGVAASAFRSHLAYLNDHHPLVLPGDALARGELSVCLTFDDATVDFFHVVFPLLEEMDAKALVAIPTAYIESATSTPLSERLAAQGSAVMSGEYGVKGNPLCTWDELRTLQNSGRVRCASHSHTHADMTAPDIDIQAELHLSSTTLTEHLGVTPDTFVYPYGRTTRSVQQQVRRHFAHAMRIGSAMNRGWNDGGGLLYRVDAESFWPRGKVWSFTDALKYRIKYLGNRVRGK